MAGGWALVARLADTADGRRVGHVRDLVGLALQGHPDARGLLRESLYARASALATRDLRILPATHGDRAGLVGCAALALDHVLAPAAVDAHLAALDHESETRKPEPATLR